MRAAHIIAWACCVALGLPGAACGAEGGASTSLHPAAECLDSLTPDVAGDDPLRRLAFLRTLTPTRLAVWVETPPPEKWLQDVLAAADPADPGAHVREVLRAERFLLGAEAAAWYVANRAPESARPFFRCVARDRVVVVPIAAPTGDRVELRFTASALAGPTRMEVAAVNLRAEAPLPELLQPGTEVTGTFATVPGQGATLWVRGTAPDLTVETVWRDEPLPATPASTGR